MSLCADSQPLPVAHMKYQFVGRAGEAGEGPGRKECGGRVGRQVSKAHGDESGGRSAWSITQPLAEKWARALEPSKPLPSLKDIQKATVPRARTACGGEGWEVGGPL